ncbi:MAG TPA: hypothetical protein VFK22_04820, partial [Candidatus Dormibacteraeota bacterium]|nr:hypothetical protein [Candidatus Dormibacteraeota bacterium]
ESLRLTPILFELGARPHPPSELYRAYLEQSEIFLGIYWQSGGWVAPGSDLSGIEDEYGRAKRLPRLIYVKEPAPDREARLNAMLERIRADAEASYRSFHTSDELAGLVLDDVAVLITERFQHSISGDRKNRVAPPRVTGNLPAPSTALVDRCDELALLKAFLSDDRVRVTVLTGPGGVGKTRLALEAALDSRHRFAGGAWLVPLASIRDPELVPAAILNTLNVPAGHYPAADAVKAHLQSRETLVLLENFEQVLGAAPYLTELVEAAPRVKILVTSRMPLHLRAEYEVPISPLRVPGERASTADQLESPAVKLFLDRIRAVRPELEFPPAEVAAAAAIVRRLDGLPLAIELAASRCRVVAPSELLSRLNAMLDLGGGLRDLPDRQRTLRSAIQWSFDLLDERDRSLFLKLAVFRGGFTVDGAAAICPELTGTALLDSLEAILDSSLIHREVLDGQSRYFMLEIVGEFAEEKLMEAGSADTVSAIHAAFVGGCVKTTAVEVFGPGQRSALRAFDRESANVAAAMDWYLASGDIERLAEMTWHFWPYWWFFGRLAEGGRRARKALDTGACSELAEARLAGMVGIAAVWLGDEATAMTFLPRSIALFRKLDERQPIATLLVLMAVGAWSQDPARAAEFIAESRSIFSATGDDWGLAICANVVAWNSPAIDGDGNPEPYPQEALALSEKSGDDLNLGMALGHVGAQELCLGRLEAARVDLARSLRLLSGVTERYAITSTIDSVGRLAALGGDDATGVRLIGAAEGIREWLQAPLQPARQKQHAQMVAELGATLAASDFKRLFDEGKRLDHDAAVTLALSVCEMPRGNRAEPAGSAAIEEAAK